MLIGQRVSSSWLMWGTIRMIVLFVLISLPRVTTRRSDQEEIATCTTSDWHFASWPLFAPTRDVRRRGVRPGSPSNMRTVASVGDKPLPSVSGEPGSSLRARRRRPRPTPHRPAREFRAGSTTTRQARSQRQGPSGCVEHSRRKGRLRDDRSIRGIHAAAVFVQAHPTRSSPSTRAKTESMTGRTQAKAPR